MNEVSAIGLDIAKHVFHAHGADALGQQIFSRKISCARQHLRYLQTRTLITRKPYTPYIPQNISDVMDQLGWMMLNSPKFENNRGYFPERSINTAFFALNEGLKTIRKKVGEENYQVLAALSGKMRTHFKADPEDTRKPAENARISRYSAVLRGVNVVGKAGDPPHWQDNISFYIDDLN